MKIFKSVLAFVFLSLMIAGCQSNKIAEQDLNRIQEVQATLADNNDQLSRLLLRFAENETLEKHVLETKVALYKKALDNGKTVSLDDVLLELDKLKQAEAKSGVIRDNTRDKIAFLTEQQEKLKALMLSLSVYIEGKKSIIELINSKTVSIKQVTTQPTTQP